MQARGDQLVGESRRRAHEQIAVHQFVAVSVVGERQHLCSRVVPIPLGGHGGYRLRRVSSSTAKAAARAVSAMYVSDGFWHAVDAMQAPSVTKTLGASHT